MFKNIIIPFFLLTVSIKAQVQVENGKIDLTFKQGKSISKFLQINTLTINKTKEFKTVMVKIKMASLTKNRETIDVNKFYLIDNKNKLRFKLIDASKRELTAYLGLPKLIKEETPPKVTKTYYYSYDPTIEDTFFNYKKDDYKDVVFSINFGTKRKPDNRIIYYKPQKLRSKKLILFFPFIDECKDATLYYGNIKIKDFKVK